MARKRRSRRGVTRTRTTIRSTGGPTRGPSKSRRGIKFRRWNRTPRGGPIAQTLTAYVKAGGASSIDDSPGTNWAGPENAEGAPDSTTALAGLGVDVLSDTLLLQFDLSAVPDEATIDGLQVVVTEWDANGSPISKRAKAQWYNAAFVGNDLADNSNMESSPTDKTWGGPTETWGLTLTPALIKGAGWSFALRYQGGSGGNGIPRVDAAQITVYYTA